MKLVALNCILVSTGSFNTATNCILLLYMSTVAAIRAPVSSKELLLHQQVLSS
jgi:hypothetical protein